MYYILHIRVKEKILGKIELDKKKCAEKIRFVCYDKVVAGSPSYAVFSTQFLHTNFYTFPTKVVSDVNLDGKPKFTGPELVLGQL